MSETVSISTLDGAGRFDCYLARPSGRPRAAIVVIQEIFGVNAGIRRKCDRLAEDGYLALAPDLFWRVEPNVELDPDIPQHYQKALGLMSRFDQDQGLRDIEATIKYARDWEHCTKVGAVGYCLGGRLAYMTAARTDADASVGY
jgi:carboxymethylenebutenolidase